MLPTQTNNQQTTNNTQPFANAQGKQSNINDQQLNPPPMDDTADDLGNSTLPATSIGEPTVSSSHSPVTAAANQPLSGSYDPLTDDNTRVTSSPVNKPPDMGGSLQKEKELLARQDEKLIEEIGKEIELEKEIKEAGVEKMGEEIEIPEPLKKAGIEKVEVSPSITDDQIKTVLLTQTQIKKALHQKVSEAIVWLAVWCLRQLKIKKKKT